MDSSSFHTLRELRKQMHHSAAKHFQNIDLIYVLLYTTILHIYYIGISYK